MEKSGSPNGEIDGLKVSIDKVINLLVNRFLFYSTIVAIIAVLIPIVPFNTSALTTEFYFDVVNIFALVSIFIFRKKLSLTFKIGCIILITYTFFITNLHQHGLDSLTNVIIVFIPFLSVLIFSVGQTIIIYSATILSFLFVALFHLPQPHNFDNPEFLNGLIEWVIYGVLLSLVCLVVALLVYYLNDSLFKLIKRFESNNHQLIRQDSILKQNIEEKKVLLQEIHHRVKNNLAVVSGLLDLQSNIAPDEFSRATLKLSTNRILSISKVHELLYQSEDISRIHFKQYIKELADLIIDSFNKTGKQIHLNLDIHIQYLNINHGVPVGIILNELFTNSLKHGFSQTQDSYQISVTAIEENDFFEIIYSDNGSGVVTSEYAKTPGLGQTLIESLLTQIDASYTLDTEKKYRMTFRFPKVTL